MFVLILLLIRRRGIALLMIKIFGTAGGLKILLACELLLSLLFIEGEALTFKVFHSDKGWVGFDQDLKERVDKFVVDLQILSIEV